MPVVNGNKYWLLRKIDLTQLGKYDIWLSQDGDKPDYPYTFTMWQYDTDAKNRWNRKRCQTRYQLCGLYPEVKYCIKRAGSVIEE